MANDVRLAVFASGHGTNFAAILDAIQAQGLSCQIVRLVVDKANAGALAIANAHHIPTLVVNYKAAGSRQAVEQQIIDQLTADGAQGILLAGYMRIITPTLLQAFPQKVINIHPALLPSFPGTHGIEDAFHYGVKITGVTVHFVDEGTDTGQIIDQQAVHIADDDTLESLEAKIHDVEHHLYPTVLAQLLKEEVFN
ncbi:phosphoribosylglycinamide formyltransferase [Weissella viridescens]|uniref:Phosphoribosylglycinamide formyltransferase n=1 Tax=Weissella viridescens TaxID=1629 RepID=A0A3P2RFI3_WEIVI|nr:phosphoribosylglycinamide formyltransferase [Weissella viridescens]RRG18406.1 phosphoribosylglycinamide formyltransferase [Weissella viridescens]